MDFSLSSRLNPAERFNRLVKSTTVHVCPLLGSDEDPALHTNYASRRNLCFSTDDILPVRSSVQRIFCLAEGHYRCPLYLLQAALRVSEEVPDLLESSARDFLRQARHR